MTVFVFTNTSKLLWLLHPHTENLKLTAKENLLIWLFLFIDHFTSEIYAHFLKSSGHLRTLKITRFSRILSSSS